MILANSTKYALRAVSALKDYDPVEYVQVAELAKRISVPAPYLSKIVKRLSKSGILLTRRGMLGGVRLSKKNKLTFYDVCVVMKDPLIISTCMMSTKKCNAKTPCQLHSQWSTLRSKLMTLLENVQITSGA